MTVGVGVVSGLSMHPTLEPGDVVVFVRYLRPVEGSIVVADLPGHGLIIKRMAATGGHSGAPPALEPGYCLLIGDNPDCSYDSRAFGPLPLRLVLGRVVVIWPDRAPSGRPNTVPPVTTSH